MIKGGYYWKGDDFELTIAKKRDLFAIMIKKGNDHQTAFFSRKEFFSFICEVVKYVLRLPIVARRIPFYESCSTSEEKPHGILESSKIRHGENGEFYTDVSPLWVRYHGIKEGAEIISWKEGEALLSFPLKTKAKIIKDCPPRWEGKETFITSVTSGARRLTRDEWKRPGVS